MARIGLTHRFNSKISMEAALAFTRNFSDIRETSHIEDFTDDQVLSRYKSKMTTHNSVTDGIGRIDFRWIPLDAMNVRFGGVTRCMNLCPTRSGER